MTDFIFVWGVILMHQSLPYVFQSAAVHEKGKKKIVPTHEESQPAASFTPPPTLLHHLLLSLIALCILDEFG